ncbi:hypothetical protein AHiyo8_pI69530 (plasmid) [Arthrobacter sp. Hiyo8]|nr:hypothetical protein AHiyo8_pI69530 [Arthrobacter sp. Hiyo8]
MRRFSVGESARTVARSAGAGLYSGQAGSLPGRTMIEEITVAPKFGLLALVEAKPNTRNGCRAPTPGYVIVTAPEKLRPA